MNEQNSPLILTESEVLEPTIKCLVYHIPLETQGAFDAEDLFQLLVKAACNCDSLENTAKGFKKAPCGKTLRYHFDKIEDFVELESQLNAALRSQRLPGIKKGKLKLAMLTPLYM